MSALAVGFAVVAKAAREPGFAGECASLAATHRAVAEQLVALADMFAVPMPRLASTCRERLRWEWLASAARLLDGAPEARLLAECSRLQAEVEDAALVASRDRRTGRCSALRRVVSALGEAAAVAVRLDASAPPPGSLGVPSFLVLDRAF